MCRKKRHHNNTNSREIVRELNNYFANIGKELVDRETA